MMRRLLSTPIWGDDFTVAHALGCTLFVAGCLVGLRLLGLVVWG